MLGFHQGLSWLSRDVIEVKMKIYEKIYEYKNIYLHIDEAKFLHPNDCVHVKQFIKLANLQSISICSSAKVLSGFSLIYYLQFIEKEQFISKKKQ